MSETFGPHPKGLSFAKWLIVMLYSQLARKLLLVLRVGDPSDDRLTRSKEVWDAGAVSTHHTACRRQSAAAIAGRVAEQVALTIGCLPYSLK